MAHSDHDPLDLQKLKELVKSYDEEEITACTVPRWRGKNGIGNKQEASNKIEYQELAFRKYSVI